MTHISSITQHFRRFTNSQKKHKNNKTPIGRLLVAYWSPIYVNFRQFVWSTKISKISADSQIFKKNTKTTKRQCVAYWSPIGRLFTSISVNFFGQTKTAKFVRNHKIMKHTQTQPTTNLALNLISLDQPCITRSALYT